MVSYSSAKEEIKRAADVVDVIGQYVALKKAGRNFMGLCPFHSEKAPSFTVNPERQTFHCFGCKKGGDIFSFWMEYHSTSFPEAMRDLAERYHITISEGYSATEEKKKANQRETLYQINEIAASFFQKTLAHNTRGSLGQKYLKKRTIPQNIIDEARLGYAPDQWDGLIRVLQKQGVNMNMAVQAGLIIRKEKGGYYDRFRGRIMFPIVDQRHRVMAFGGRVMDDSLPKYLNSPETPVFNKGASLYGLNSAFNAIREKGRAVIVEGYMDWLALKKHGLHEAVATLGTALTDKHVRKLKGFAREVITVFDADEAGKSAALKSLHVFANEGLTARAVVLPEGHDPDTFINQKGLDDFQNILSRALPMIDFFLDQKMKKGDSDEDKARALKDILPVLNEIRDFTLRALYVKRLSDTLGVREDVVLTGLKTQQNGLAAVSRLPFRHEASVSQKKRKSSPGDLQLLHLVINHPDALPRLMECDCCYLVSDPAIEALIREINNVYLQQGHILPENLLEHLKNETDKELLREALHNPFTVFTEEDSEQAIIDFEKKAHIKKVNASIRKTKTTGDIIGQNELLRRKIQGPGTP